MRRDDLAEAVAEVGGDAGVALLKLSTLVAEVRARTREVAIGWTRPCAGVVGAVPHQLDRLADRLARPRRPPARASKNSLRPKEPPPCDDVHRDLRPRQAELRRDRLLGDDRRLQRGPDLGPVGPDVGDRAVGLQRAVAAEVEGELAPRRSSAGRDARARPAAARRLRSSRERRLVGLAFDGAGGSRSTLSARTASMHWPKVAGAHRHAGGDHRRRR